MSQPENKVLTIADFVTDDIKNTAFWWC